MKMLQKNIYGIVGTVVLAMVVLYGVLTATVPQLRFSISSDGETKEISIYKAEDGNSYVFLPSYANMEDVRVIMSPGQRISLGGINLSNGMTCENFMPETGYSLKINDRQKAVLWFYQSANVATMYLDTATGSMRRIHEDKNYEENASITLYTENGDINYYDELITVGGRGNSSWNLTKKPYTITLSKSSSLLNMGTSEKWVLNSNGFDTSNLRNKVVYDFAEATAMDTMWAPDCNYVDVFLNGEYAGLYLLCQKIDTGPDHLGLLADDYYFELMLRNRVTDSSTVFDVSTSISAEVIAPDSCSDSQLAVLQSYINLFQEALFSEDGVSLTSGLSYSDYIDMDSWARKYLIEEVFSNYDGGRISQFFWLDASEQKLYAGHCWDYDHTFGKFWGTSWSTPYCMLAQRNWKGNTSWYNALCQKDEFMDVVVEIYKTEIRPLLQKQIDEVIQNTATDIRYAALSDQLRWPMRYSEEDWGTSVEAMVEYLRARMVFLDSLWLDNAEFCTITLETEETYNICVPAGTVCTDLPQPSEFGLSGVWYVLETNTPFDATLPIIMDITVVLQTPEAKGNAFAKITESTRDYITLVSIAMLGFMLLCFVCVDYWQRSKERRNASACSRTKIST